MSIDLDRELRATLGRLAETPPPGDLAERTVRSAHRRHRRVVAARTVVALTAVVLAIPAGLAVVARGTGGDGQPGGPVGRMAVTSLSLLTTGPDGSPLPPLDDAGTAYHSLVLDPRTGTYRDLEYDAAALSPDGRTVLVADGNNGVASPYRAGLLDLETNVVRWITLSLTVEGVRLNPFTARWSPDGGRVLLEADAPKGPDAVAGFAIVDPGTLQARYVSVHEPASDDVAREGLFWMPDGNGLVGTLYRSVVAERDSSEPVGLRVLDLDGNVVRDIPVAGWLSGERSFAPGGRRVALATGENHPWTNLLRIVDVSSGAVVAEVPLAERSVLVGWYDDDHLVVRPVNTDRTGAGPPRPLQVVDLTGRVVRTVQLPRRAVDTADVRIDGADVLGTIGSAVTF
jgi:hypothetical protein